MLKAKLLPKHLILNNTNIFDQKTIANSFNEYFVNVGPKLTSEIPQSQGSFEMYLKGFDSTFEEVTLSDGKIKTVFFSLKSGKSPGFDEVNYDIVKKKSNSLLVPLKCVFDFSLKRGIFPEKMKIARATPEFLGLAKLHSRPVFACADFSAYPHGIFHHNADCQIKRSLFGKNLDKIKIKIKYIKYKIFVNGLRNKFVRT